MDTRSYEPADGEAAFAHMRDEIQLSWKRSRQALVPIDRIEIPFGELDDDAARLLRVASPVLEQFASNLDGTSFSLVLADREGRVLGTWAGERAVRKHLSSLSIDLGFVLSEANAGTNGIGTVLEDRRPVVVWGHEHYVEPFRHLVCAGAPVYNPVTGHFAGVLDIASPNNNWSEMVAASLAQLRQALERELADRASTTQRLVFEMFVARCHETTSAVAALSEQYMLTNAAAADLLAPADQTMLWTELGQRADGTHSVTLSAGHSVDVTSRTIQYGNAVAGRLIELSRGAAPPRRRVHAVCDATPWSVKSVVRQVDATANRVLVRGGPGTGKRTVARQIHEKIAPGRLLWEASCDLSLLGAGTAWLDDVADHLRSGSDTVLLHHIHILDDPIRRTVAALVERHPHSRVIATSAPDDGSAAGDPLMERFASSRVTLPPLRERQLDMARLATSILRDLGSEHHLSGRAVGALQRFEWPGNYRQLASTLADAAHAAGVMGTIGLEHLPGEIRAGFLGPRNLTRIQEIERNAMIGALRESGGNKVVAAESLGMSRSTFYRRMRQLRLDPSILLQ